MIDIGLLQIAEVLFRRWRPRIFCQVIQAYPANKIPAVTTITNIHKTMKIPSNQSYLIRKLYFPLISVKFSQLKCINIF
jgi:hypothetical protein